MMALWHFFTCCNDIAWGPVHWEEAWIVFHCIRLPGGHFVCVSNKCLIHTKFPWWHERCQCQKTWFISFVLFLSFSLNTIDVHWSSLFSSFFHSWLTHQSSPYLFLSWHNFLLSYISLTLSTMTRYDSPIGYAQSKQIDDVSLPITSILQRKKQWKCWKHPVMKLHQPLTQPPPSAHSPSKCTHDAPLTASTANLNAIPSL